ncbi:AAA family ATPase [Paraliomyxa miuraensis]|uniref:AAA family ATPase n=1 Tax=Paraliomyxa miuraensis TaxID=376150 RepID=UPI002255E88C|nr:AAA family ATPase [Paraliomyxa miuraensis]MCX4239206.1 AAA family ATPase [Paraliomyxa miuraensis]
MYVRKLRIDGLKLLRDFELDFTRDGEPRMWTVLVGRNGLCKTAILRALALAASGRDRANQLAQGLHRSLRDVRDERRELWIHGSFGFGAIGEQHGRHHPGKVATPTRLRTWLALMANRQIFEGGSGYMRGDHDEHLQSMPSAEWFVGSTPDPLEQIRAASPVHAHWFTAAYGVNRSLPVPMSVKPPDDITHDRVASLFDNSPIIGTGFADLFDNGSARTYARVIKKAMLAHADLLPAVTDVELGGRGGVNTADRLVTSHRFKVRSGDAGELKIPATWLSQGYQAAIAWLADLVGQVLWEANAAGGDGEIEPEEMEGLVLVDELDLHLHPTWQVGFIAALKTTFPRLQFVVTTHSPMLLAGLEAHEIVMLEEDLQTGNVVARHEERPPKLLTATQLLERYFAIDRLYPVNLAEKLRRYDFIASNPYRSDEEDREMSSLRAELEAAGAGPKWEPVERSESA